MTNDERYLRPIQNPRLPRLPYDEEILTSKVALEIATRTTSDLLRQQGMYLKHEQVKVLTLYLAENVASSFAETVKRIERTMDSYNGRHQELVSNFEHELLNNTSHALLRAANNLEYRLADIADEDLPRQLPKDPDPQIIEVEKVIEKQKPGFWARLTGAY